MNQPLTVPLFLPRIASDQSQSKGWRTATPGADRSGRCPAPPQCPTGAGPGRADHRRFRCGAAAGSRHRWRRPPAAGHGSPAGSDQDRRPDEVPGRLGHRHHRPGPVHGLAGQPGGLDGPAGHPGQHLHAGLSGLEWTVNAYTLTFAVLLLSAAAMGERFGRRRIFVLGIAVFTGGVGRGRPGPEHRGAGHGPGRPGRRRGHDHAPLAHPAERGGAARAAQRRPRDLGGHRRCRRGPRTAGRRSGDQRLVVAVHLLAQRPRRAGADPAGLVEAVRVPRGPGPSRPGRRGPGQRRPVRAWSSAWSRATATGGPAPRCSRPSSSERWRWSPSWPGSSAPTIRCWTSGCSATAASPRST